MPEKKMIVARQEVSPFMTNCYLVGCAETREAALIDPENYRHPFEMNDSSCDDFSARSLTRHDCCFCPQVSKESERCRG